MLSQATCRKNPQKAWRSFGAPHDSQLCCSDTSSSWDPSLLLHAIRPERRRRVGRWGQPENGESGAISGFLKAARGGCLTSKTRPGASLGTSLHVWKLLISDIPADKTGLMQRCLFCVRKVLVLCEPGVRAARRPNKKRLKGQSEANRRRPRRKKRRINRNPEKSTLSSRNHYPGMYLLLRARAVQPPPCIE